MRFRRFPRTAAPIRLERSRTFERFEGSERARRAADWRRVRAELRQLSTEDRRHVLSRWERVPLDSADPMRLWVILQTRQTELMDRA